jgi:hypothetical protein
MSYTLRDAWRDFISALTGIHPELEKHVEAAEPVTAIPEIPLPGKPVIRVFLPSDPKPVQGRKRKAPAPVKAKRKARGLGLRTKGQPGKRRP